MHILNSVCVSIGCYQLANLPLNNTTAFCEQTCEEKVCELQNHAYVQQITDIYADTFNRALA